MESKFPKEIFLPKDARGRGAVGRLRREVLPTWLDGVMGGTELGVQGLEGAMCGTAGEAGVLRMVRGDGLGRRLTAGSSRLGWGLGSSPPNMFGLRCTSALALEVRVRACSVLFPLDAIFEVGLEGVLGIALERVAGLEDDVGRAGGAVGVGEAAFRRALFAFWLRSFSSSSEEVASEFFALKSILIAADSKLLRELPKDGARLMPGVRNDDPVNVSERRIRRETTMG